MYQKNIVLITSIFLLFGCMDKTKLNNDSDAASIEEKSDNPSPQGITFKKNADGKYVLFEGSFADLRKKEADQAGVPDGNDREATDVSSSEIETVPAKRKSMLEQFTTITWPWEKN